jgi:hypothetical protein
VKILKSFVGMTMMINFKSQIQILGVLGFWGFGVLGFYPFGTFGLWKDYFVENDSWI